MKSKIAMNRVKKSLLYGSFCFGLTMVTGQISLATPLALPNEPLTLVSSVPANVMFLLDNSGSMSNIVPDVPYDANVNYFNCPAGQLAGIGQVDIRITSSGTPYFNQSSTDYDWGVAAGTGATGLTTLCFGPNINYIARLAANSGSGPLSPSGYLPAQYTGNYLNWYFGSKPTNWSTGAQKKPGTEQRMEIAKVASNSIINSLNNVRVGLTTYNGGDGALILQEMDDIANNRANVITDINTLSPTSSTPLAESLRDIGEYFAVGNSGSLTMYPDDPLASTSVLKSSLFSRIDYTFTPPATAPIQYYCQKNFAVLMTDGRPQSDQDISTELQDYDGDCAIATPACLSEDRKSGRIYESAGSDYLDDVAMAWYDIDLRPDLSDSDGNPVKNNLTTYTIGFADDQVINDPLMQDTANSGGGIFLPASNAAQLAAAFNAATTAIGTRIGVNSAVTFNTATLKADSSVFLAFFNSGNWSGDLVSFDLDSQGIVDPTPGWSAASLLDSGTPAFGSRTVITHDVAGAVGSDGVPFRVASLSAAQLADLNSAPWGTDQNALDFIRGDRSNETLGKFRTRASILGDIVNGAPVFVGTPNLGWPSTSPFPTADGERYKDFKQNLQTNPRTEILYVGANDGMLHGFRADTGQELLAYIPGLVYSSLSNEGLHYLADPTYEHRFYVDLNPTVSDVYIKASSGGSVAWRTILIGGQRAGGRGLFALDVSDPSQFAEANAAAISLWEFTHNDLGFTYSKPTIAMMENGRWAAIFGNGYNATGSGEAKLFILFIDGGVDGTWTDGSAGTDLDYMIISTGTNVAATPNGLATPALVDINGNGAVDRAYAGDLEGNLWAFDLSDNSTLGSPNTKPAWGSAYSTSGTPNPLLIAMDASSTRQPITSKPIVAFHPDPPNGNNDPNVMVYVGTGKYLEKTDLSDTSVQSFYGVWDHGIKNLDRTALVAQTINSGPFTDSDGVIRTDLRVLSDTPVDYTTQHGWVIDLPAAGERVIVNSQIRGSLVFFNTWIPDSTACGSGGSGFLMSVEQLNGGEPDSPAFGINATAGVDDSDTVNDGSGYRAPAGQAYTNGLPASSSFLSNKQYTPGTGSKLIETRDVEDLGTPNTGRLSWLQLNAN